MKNETLTFADLHDKHCHADVVVVGPTIAFIDGWDMDNQELICSTNTKTIVWDMTELPTALFYTLEDS